MNNIRLLQLTSTDLHTTCSRCAQQGTWDHIVLKAYCPACEETLVRGESDPLVEPTQPQRCVVCQRVGTVRYRTHPLEGNCAVEVELCAEHLRALLGRFLTRRSYHQLRRLLTHMQININDVFLLHDAFYDEQGSALRPAVEM